MVGFGENGEEQKFASFQSSSDSKTDRSISGSLATLQQEVHTLAKNSLPEIEQDQQVATRENVYDEHGNIIDVLFHQNSKSINLKSLLPGSYTIEISQDKPSKAYKKENKIRVNAANERDFNVRLLHEAGHMVDFQTNQREYQQVEKEALNARLNELLLTSKIIEVTDGGTLLPQTLSLCQKIAEEEKANLTDEDSEEITKTYKQSYQYLTAQHALEELSQERDRQHTLLLRSSTIGEVTMERNAWKNALVALRELQQQGITTFAGTRKELLQTIDRALGSYEYLSGKNLLATDRHFTRDLPIK